MHGFVLLKHLHKSTAMASKKKKKDKKVEFYERKVQFLLLQKVKHSEVNSHRYKYIFFSGLDALCILLLLYDKNNKSFQILQDASILKIMSQKLQMRYQISNFLLIIRTTGCSKFKPSDPVGSHGNIWYKLPFQNSAVTNSSEFISSYCHLVIILWTII